MKKEQIKSFLLELKSFLKELSAAFRYVVRRFSRNSRALWLRVLLGIRHKNADETLHAIVRMINEGIWAFCWFVAFGLVPTWLICPHCIIMSGCFVVLAAIWRSINIDKICR